MMKLRGHPFFDRLLEMYGERYQVAEYFRSDGPSKPLRSMENETGDLDRETDSETGDGDGHADGRGVARGNPVDKSTGSPVVDRNSAGPETETLDAQRRIDARRAMNRKQSS